jgi:two-component system CheB/CheR fusion protein
MLDFTIVGIGASAGGLEALKTFLSHIPNDSTNISYVIVQHLSQTHKSVLRKILSNDTLLDVVDIKNEMVVEPNKVYIAPSNNDLVLQDGFFKLHKVEDTFIRPKPSVDKFFISLAHEMQENAVGVILSGTGNDGSQGVKVLRIEGGTTIAQDPVEAKYDGMPLSAINTKSIDYILKAEDIAKEIPKIISLPKRVNIEDDSELALSTIFQIIQNHIKVDFSGYKRSTIVRRIEKRMSVVKSTNLDDYISYLNSNAEEVEFLYKCMLIGVTEFFRDKESFEALEKNIKSYLKQNRDTDSFRIWIPACSTGEEAYSMAIIMSELIGLDKHIKIFATDIDEDSIEFARRGIFSLYSLLAVPQKLLNKYFEKKLDGFEARNILKEKIIFSKHNLISDTPFVNFDLISCRNLLIYFDSDLQKRVFSTFAYSLRQNGFLFLGKSENIGTNSDSFETIDAKHKIFQARVTNESKKSLYPQLINIGRYKSELNKTKKGNSLEEIIKNTLFNTYLNRCAVIDSSFNLHYIKGDFDGLVKLPQGIVYFNILKMLPEDLSIEVRSLVYKALKYKDLKFPISSVIRIRDSKITLNLTPLENDKNYQFFLLCIDSEIIKNSNVDINSNTKDYVVQTLQQELMTTKEHLQTVVEEIENTNEELQALNEELQTSNEELQASNEKLETTNEELESTNEELQIAYSEIRSLYSMEKEKKEKNYFATFNEVCNNIVILTDGKEILEINDEAFKYISKSNDFGKNFEKVDEDDYIYGINWLEKVILSEKNCLRAKIVLKNKTYIFKIMKNRFSKDKFIISLIKLWDK